MQNYLSSTSIKILSDPTNMKTVPYNYVIIDDFLSDKVLKDLMNFSEQLKHTDSDWRKIGQKTTSFKYTYDKIEKFPTNIQDIFAYFNSREFIQIVENFFGISDFVINNFRLKGAGIHKIRNKGFLNLHTDFNNYYDSEFGSLDRRINLLIYLNKDWKEEYGGHFWICGKEDKKIYQKILPILNRCVIFATSNASIHGHPIPLSVPNDDIERNSLALYYYTKNQNGDRCFENDEFHSTIYYETEDFSSKETET